MNLCLLLTLLWAPPLASPLGATARGTTATANAVGLLPVRSARANAIDTSEAELPPLFSCLQISPERLSKWNLAGKGI